MSDAALVAANIDAEATPDRLSLYLPVDEPIWGGQQGLRAVLGLTGSSVLLCMGATGLSLASQWGESFLMLAILIGLIAFAAGMLTLRDALKRLWQRKVDENHPIRELRERIDLTLHDVVTGRGTLVLSTIQSLHIDPIDGTLIAQTAAGEVPIANHRTEQVVVALSQTIAVHAQRRRAGLIADGLDPDAPEAIPEVLQRFRGTTATPQR